MVKELTRRELVAIAYTKPGTMLTYYLNKFWTGGFIWSLVRSSVDGPKDDQYWNQPPLRFDSLEAAQAFIADTLGGNPDAKPVTVQD